MIFLLLYFAIVILTSIMAHELGHFLMVRHYKVKAKFCLFKIKWMEGALSPKQKINVYIAGIMLGYIVYSILTYRWNCLLWFSGFMFYLAGCIRDMAKIRIEYDRLGVIKW